MFERLFCWLAAIATIGGMNAHAAQWFVSASATAHGAGSITNPWPLQTALTNPVVQPGDTVWLRNGVYFPTTTFADNSVNVLGWTPTVSGSPTNPITFRSYTNEWAAIDREWSLKACANLCFRDLEFYDSLKGHNLTNSAYPNGPWSHFTMADNVGFQWINCLIHDVDDCWSGGVQYQVRGCVLWYVGWNNLEHVCYPAPTNFSGNISGWHIQNVINFNTADMICASNILFGGGDTVANPANANSDILGGGYNELIAWNYFYNRLTNAVTAKCLNLQSSPAGNMTVCSNIVVAPAPVNFAGNDGYNTYGTVTFLGNTVFASSTNYDAAEISWSATNGTWTFGNNSYYCVPGNDIWFFVLKTYHDSLDQWQSKEGFDLTSAASAQDAPPYSVQVIPNQDQPKRANIAVYNWPLSNNVVVDLSAVLAAGDSYELFSAQNFKAGPIQSGIFNGTNITVPMTNLSVAPILYGTNVNYSGEIIAQPWPTSPEFGAFVVIGAAAQDSTAGINGAQSAQTVPFDGMGSSVTITNQGTGQWGLFQIVVPADTNLLGWDIRLTGVSNGNPQFVICRDTFPTGPGTGPLWNNPFYFSVSYPWQSTNWPGGWQWGSGVDWTGCGGGPMLQMGMGNPLVPGTYYIGVQDMSNTSSYTLQSRGIGSGYTIPVGSLSLTGTATNLALPAGEAAYYQVVVPPGTQDWTLQLKALTGDALLKVQRDYLPNNGGEVLGNWPYGFVPAGQGGQLMEKPGDEQWTLLPYYDTTGQTNLLAGTYYVLVASQGQNLINSCEGSGICAYTLSSGVGAVTQLGTVGYTNDLLFTNVQAGGAALFYQFTVPTNIASIEVALKNRVGNPWMTLNSGANLVSPAMAGGQVDGYGNFGGVTNMAEDGSLLTIPNPQPGAYSLTIYGADDGSGAYPGASYVLQVHAVSASALAFDAGAVAVANQPAGAWQFFEVMVPPDTNLLGWDIRLTGVTNGNPQFTVCRDRIPAGIGSGPPWDNPSYYGVNDPWRSSNWPSGWQWDAGADWGGCGCGPMLQMGMGNPLQAGTYYIGVQDASNTSSYTLQSRGIGTGYAIPVRSLQFNGTVTNLALTVGQADYYQVVVPAGAQNWTLDLSAVTGETLLKVQEGFLPNSGSGGQANWPYGYVVAGQGGQLMDKLGDEHWTLLPYYDSTGKTNLLAGTYYVLVGSQGQDLTNGCEGTGNAGYILSSGAGAVAQLNTVAFGSDLLFTNTQAGGQTKFYQFNVPTNIACIEVALNNRVGDPWMTLNSGTNLVTPEDSYGNYGGTNYQWSGGEAITIPNVTSGLYSLSVNGTGGSSGSYPNANYILRVRALAVPPLSFSQEFDNGNLAGTASGVLADSEHAYYQVTVPATVTGAPVLGWELDLSALEGLPFVRVRQNLLPDNTCDTTAFAAPNAIVAPPYLTPGTWYVDVVGSGLSIFTLTSQVITTNSLAQPAWQMPLAGQTNTTAGLAPPMIGDSGVDTSGIPLPGDQGINLQQGAWDFYAVIVPTNNAGLLRTELEAISGNPHLYLRAGAAPTLSHYADGSCDWWDVLVDRQLSNGVTEIGNWVPLNGRYESALTPGVWVLAVQAGGNLGARYRLQASCGNSVSNGLVQDLALGGGSFTNQNLSGGDWRYYRVQIPDPAPANWNVTFSCVSNTARMFVRDTSPPGDGSYPSPALYSNANYNPGPGSPDLQSWNSDNKNEDPYPRFDTPGTYTLTTPPLRPGSIYYLGFWSPGPATFSVSSVTNGGTIAVTNTLSINGGAVNGSIAAYGTVLYRLDAPSNDTRIVFNASNSASVVFSLEQGTPALPGGPAQWTSSTYGGGGYSNESNVSFNQYLLTSNDWPWLPGYSYYIALTNTSSSAQNYSITMSEPADLAVVAFNAPTNVVSSKGHPSIEIDWGVTNQGAGLAAGSDGYWYDRVWFSTNGMLDGQSVDIGDFYVNGPVAPGGGYWQTVNVTLPTRRSGSYALFVQVDAGNDTYDSNPANNISGPIFLRLIPPLSFGVSSANLHWTNGGLQMQVEGLSGQAVVISASTDMVHWMPIYTNPPASGSMQFLDVSATNFSARFYQAQEP